MVGAEEDEGMAVNLVSPVISYRNTLCIHGYNGKVLKGSV